jgi:hypothetical protein
LGSIETGLTYHRHKASALDFAGQMLLPYQRDAAFFYESENVSKEEERFALDARWDGFVGVWNEAVLARSTQPALDDEINAVTRVMVGGDYTLPWGDGIYVMVEHLWSRLDYLQINPPAS